MNKNLFTILAVMVIASALVLFFSESDEIPPTPAYQTIETGVVSVVPLTGDNTTTALVYNDKLYILTDSSINLTISTYP